MKLFLAFLSLFAMFSCARVQTLNLVPHKYSDRPDHIVWIQVAGFSEEHIPLLRFNVANANYQTNLEQADCVGKIWSYNLYQLRPEASKSFLSQINGSKNIKGTCEDYSTGSSWSMLEKIGYIGAILENGASVEQSLEKSLSCQDNKVLDLAKMRYYQMKTTSQEVAKTFHYQDSPEQLKATTQPGLYFDRSCQKGLCYSTVSNNFKTLWENLIKDRQKSYFLVRDFNFQAALKKKDISLAKESLQEIDRIVATIKKNKETGVLVIISGAETMPIEFPLQGKEWADFEKSGKNLIYKNSTLMSPVLASGPMSENFCGIFDESEMLKRIIYRPEEKQFNWDAINPF